MMKLTNARLISLTLVLVLLAPAQQISAPDRSESPIARFREFRRRPLPRMPGVAPQIVVPLPGQSTTLLPDGTVLAIGGDPISGFVSRASINGTTISAVLQHSRAWHTASVLPDGTVLVFGGIDAQGLVSAAELFSPVSRGFSIASGIGLSPRAHHTATLFTDGTLLIAGGIDKNGKASDRLDLWDFKSQTSQSLPARLNQARKDHTATLQSDGTVRIEGGVLDSGLPATTIEVFDPATGSVVSGGAAPSISPLLQVAASMPTDGSSDVSVDSLVSLRFSRPLDVKSVNSTTVTVRDQNGPHAAQIIGAETGMLAFVLVEGGLELDSTYTVSVHGATDKNGFSIQPADFSFLMKSSGLGISANISSATGSQDDPPIQPLQAGPGITALSGSARTVSGKYLQGVTLELNCGEVKAKRNKAISDGTGRFLIPNVPAGHCKLEIDGTTVHRGTDVYGIFTPGVDITTGSTNVLPYTIWMTPLDTAHAVTIPSPTSGTFVVKNPTIPDLELHLPPNAVIKDYDGNVINQLSLTQIPLARPPFPLPGGVSVPFYFTIQPGGAYIEVNGAPGGAQLYYPNQNRAPAGFKMDFWNYDPSGKGWYVYGRGTVDPNRRFVVPDPGTEIYQFTGAMVGSSSNGGNGGAGTGGASGGEPVDLGTGIFTYQHTDLFLPDVLPVGLVRTYRQWDPLSHAFGVGMSHNLDIFIVGDVSPWTYIDLIRADGSRVHFTRTSSGTSYTDAVYQAQSDPDFLGSQIVYNGNGWTLTHKNGTQWIFPDSYLANSGEKASIIAVRDRHGNTINMSRDTSTGRLLKVTSHNGKWISFTYDGYGRITQATDNSGRSVNYQYDIAGRLVTVTNPAGNAYIYTYDANNHMLTLQDNRGIVYLTNQYDSQGRVSQQNMADGGVWQFAYTTDGSGNIIQTDVTDPRGKVRRTTFNTSSYFGGGKLTGETFAYGTSDAQAYTRTLQSGTNLLLSVTDALSHVTSLTYDSKGNMLTVTRAYGTSSAATTTLTYDSTFSQVTSVTDPLSHATSLSLNGTGDPTTVTDPLSHQFTFTYNASGQPLTATNSAGTTTFTYNSGLLASVADPLGNTSNASYDSLGRLVGATDALGNSTRYDYDAVSNLLHVTDPLSARTSFGYDPNGNLQSLTDALGNVTSYTYNNMDGLASRTDAFSHSQSYSYDLIGNPSAFTDRKSQATGYAYDNLGRLHQVTFADSSTVTYTYDAANRVTQIVDSISGTITRTYDVLNRLTNETTPQGSVTYTYDAASRRSSMTVYGQSAVGYTWDNANRLTNITQGGATVTLAYDSANRRSSLTLPNGIAAAYGYDGASRLNSITYTKGGTTIGNLTYGYDAAGNVTSKGGTLASTGLPTALTSATYNANNQLTQWGSTNLSYDLNGNMTSDGTTTYTWDARNQLSAFGSTGFAYDSFGRRTQNATGTAFLYDGVNAVQELSGGSVTANSLTGGVDEIFTRTDSGGARNFLTDALGSPIALTDSSGSTQTQYSYEPFGNTSATGSSSSNTFQYTARENDGTGLFYYRARYYHPTLQRFISEDPLGWTGGINFYAYTGNDPVEYWDPFGLNKQKYHSCFGGDTVCDAAGNPASGVGIGMSLDGDALNAVAALMSGGLVPAAVIESGAEDLLPDAVFSAKAPMQVTPGIAKLEGQVINDLGRVEPWTAHYDEFGRLIGRTDYNAGNLAQGIPDVHYHTYQWGPGMNPLETGSHITGVFK